jgi:hypothetical protein
VQKELGGFKGSHHPLFLSGKGRVGVWAMFEGIELSDSTLSRDGPFDRKDFPDGVIEDPQAQVYLSIPGGEWGTPSKIYHLSIG